MRHAGVPRRELGTATIFNFLGPLTNPAGARRQALGVADPAMVERMVETLGRLGSTRVIAFHGADGLDELATSGPSQVVELNEGDVTRWTIDPGDLGLPPAPISAISGGTSEENAAAIRRILAGETGPRRDIVLLNAAAGLLAGGLAADMADGLAKAGAAVDDGAAASALDRMIEVSTGV
jgi:anthranilate phosphoribosyltransferase